MIHHLTARLWTATWRYTFVRHVYIATGYASGDDPPPPLLTDDKPSAPQTSHYNNTAPPSLERSAPTAGVRYNPSYSNQAVRAQHNHLSHTQQRPVNPGYTASYQPTPPPLNVSRTSNAPDLHNMHPAPRAALGPVKGMFRQGFPRMTELMPKPFPQKETQSNPIEFGMLRLGCLGQITKPSIMVMMISEHRYCYWSW